MTLTPTAAQTTESTPKAWVIRKVLGVNELDAQRMQTELCPLLGAFLVEFGKCLDLYLIMHPNTQRKDVLSELVHHENTHGFEHLDQWKQYYRRCMWLVDRCAETLPRYVAYSVDGIPATRTRLLAAWDEYNRPARSNKRGQGALATFTYPGTEIEVEATYSFKELTFSLVNRDMETPDDETERVMQECMAAGGKFEYAEDAIERVRELADQEEPIWF